ncbi:pectin lyase fold/virulence factor [Roridomyces roridus]|uniref:galacturonan 1,4-alpha-galacturonidase n=1 Tax=Roridomyces roridus TaxID=1738132 RepID=A0AAD7CC45_9AGAR|nr:pectin lyase fold/virulence factor [Roridomyces roridus]
MRLVFPSLLLALTVSASQATHSPHASCTLTAAGSGKDDSPAFISAMQSCSTVVVPTGTTLNISTRLNTTGLSNKHLSLQGTMRFNPNIPYWSANGFPFTFQTQITFWILGGTNIVVDGGGTLDGAGQAWYDAFASNSSLLRPITLTLFQATTMINSPEWFNFVNEGKNVTFNNVTFTAASTSSNGASNTDGWDIYRSDQVTIKNSVINNGDDCVSFKPNTTNTVVSNLNCTPLPTVFLQLTSASSLGQFPGVFDIVENCDSYWDQVTLFSLMSNAQNGARIKAFAGSGKGSGSVKNIVFSGFIESAVDNPVVIDQCYMTDAADCTAFPSNVVINNVTFNMISGTSTGKTVASLECSPDSRCSNILVENFSLKPPSGTATYACQNVNLTGNAASLFPACTVT